MTRTLLFLTVILAWGCRSAPAVGADEAASMRDADALLTKIEAAPPSQRAGMLRAHPRERSTILASPPLKVRLEHALRGER